MTQSSILPSSVQLKFQLWLRLALILTSPHHPATHPTEKVVLGFNNLRNKLATTQYVANLSIAELGTAQPQLVFFFIVVQLIKQNSDMVWQYGILNKLIEVTSQMNQTLTTHTFFLGGIGQKPWDKLSSCFKLFSSERKQVFA